MGKYITTIADSKIGAGPLVNITDPAASTYLLEAGAFLQATSGLSIFMTGAGAWTATINGQSSGGFTLLGAGAASKVSVGEDGSLQDTGSAAFGSDRDTAFANKGVVLSTASSAVQFYGNGTNSVTNSGVIASGSSTAVAFFGTSNDTVTNSGQIFGGLEFGDGTNKLVNTGQITNGQYGTTFSNIGFGSGADNVDNKGLIDGFVNLGEGSNTVKNSGQILGKDVEGNSIFGSSGSHNDKLDNLKGAVIAGGVDLFSGANSFTNAGVVGINNIQASFWGGHDVDIVKNSGTLSGDVNLFKGNDVFTNTGIVDGTIELGEGDDVFKGGNFTERVFDYKGGDKISLGGGNDVFFSFGGEGSDDLTDTVDGGTGIDLYHAAFENIAVFVNFDGAQRTSNGWGGFGLPILNKASAIASDGGAADNLKGFENFQGSDLNDIFFGSSGANGVEGGGGFDELHGLGGNDNLDGGNNDDYLSGGLGADVLRGGVGFDQFDYSSATESGATKATRDTISDFEAGIDGIHFSGSLAGVFTSYIGENVKFTGAGQLRALSTATGTLLEGDIDGNGKPDFSIFFDDPNHTLQFTLVGDDVFGVI